MKKTKATIKDRIHLPSKKKVIIAVFIFFIACLALLYSFRSIKNSSLFQIDYIIADEKNTVDLSYLMGKNIFTIDLGKEANYIRGFHPNYYKIRLIRILPNRLFVAFVKRKPQALIKLYRDFGIDCDGILFLIPEELEKQGLTYISGLETKIFGPKTGKRYNIKELTFALGVIKEASKRREFQDYRLYEINVADLDNAKMFISLPYEQSKGSFSQGIADRNSLLEVKFGQDSITEKLNILRSLLKQERSQLANIKYIDLRFKEPVVKFKDDK